MLPPDPEPRMAPVQPEEFNEETQAFLGRWTGGFFKEADRNPVLQTFAHHPKLAELFSQFNIHILTTNTMPVKQRQIAIMRTAWITKATYMWSSHLNTSVACGLSDDMFRPIQMGPDDPYFTDFERTVMLATDELVNDRTISDENWKKLMAEWTNQQMLDFMFTVGCYLTSAMVMRATGVQRMPDLLALAEKYGAPE
jgi:alkylhydroperoxidase family enzyme